jgi:hypothetical protein
MVSGKIKFAEPGRWLTQTVKCEDAAGTKNPQNLGEKLFREEPV